MKGAVIGDIAGSRFEWDNCRSRDFELFHPASAFTDDTVLTCAVARAFLDADGAPDLAALTACLQDFGRRYAGRGYGGRFCRWLQEADPAPYNSWGNGAPMRCSAAGWAARSLAQAEEWGGLTAEPTHNHPEGKKAAALTAGMIFLGRGGASPSDLLAYAAGKEYRPLGSGRARAEYRFDVSCRGTMPAVLAALGESDGFEDTIRRAVAIGGDSDTIAAIAGSVAEAVYGVPEVLWQGAERYLTEELADIVARFYRRFVRA